MTKRTHAQRNWTRDDDRTLIDLRRRGLNMQIIASHLTRSRSDVRERIAALSEQGISMRASAGRIGRPRKDDHDAVGIANGDHLERKKIIKASQALIDAIRRHHPERCIHA